LSIRHSQFRAAILDLAAAVLKRPKDALDSEDIRQYRRTRRLARSAIAALATLLVIAMAAAYVATQERNLAIARELSAWAAVSLRDDPERS
jgi:hypothetical protein